MGEHIPQYFYARDSGDELNPDYLAFRAVMENKFAAIGQTRNSWFAQRSNSDAFATAMHALVHPNGQVSERLSKFFVEIRVSNVQFLSQDEPRMPSLAEASAVLDSLLQQ